jgi:hypothetical protein
MELITLNSRLLQVRYSKGIKRLTLERVLASKIVHYAEEITLDDLLILFDNLLWCQDKAACDPAFQKKHGEPLKRLTEILKNQNYSRSSIKIEQIRKLGKILEKELVGFLFYKRNVKPEERKLRHLVTVEYPRPNGVPLKQLPPKAYIGKGYSDKGTAKKPWLDGSPSWQEVASIPLEEL